MKEGTPAEGRQDEPYCEQTQKAIPSIPAHPGLRPEDGHPTTHHCAKCKQKIFPSKVAWEPELGCQWLLWKLQLKQNHHPASSYIQWKFPESSPTAYWTNLGNMERRLVFPINMAKRETVLPQTPISQPGMAAEKTETGIHTATCFSTSCALDNILLGYTKYTPRIY